jgi:hypothetical protein
LGEKGCRQRTLWTPLAAIGCHYEIAEVFDASEVNSDDSHSSIGGDGNAFRNAFAESQNLTGSEQHFSTDHATKHYVRRSTLELEYVCRRVSVLNKSPFLESYGVIGQEPAPSTSSSGTHWGNVDSSAGIQTFGAFFSVCS